LDLLQCPRKHLRLVFEHFSGDCKATRLSHFDIGITPILSVRE
jgi:hypothetical protein